MGEGVFQISILLPLRRALRYFMTVSSAEAKIVAILIHTGRDRRRSVFNLAEFPSHSYHQRLQHRRSFSSSNLSLD